MLLNKINIATRGLIHLSKKRPPENPQVIIKYVRESFERSTPITFFDWECPPRFLDRDKNGRVFVNYKVDLIKIFNNSAIDEYTEIPKVVANNYQEIKTLQYLNTLGLRYRFVKIIADTNGFYITPECLDIIGARTITNQFRKFKILIAKNTRRYPAAVKTYLFSELMAPYLSLYDSSFALAMRSFDNDRNKLASRNILAQQIARTKKHIGLSDIKYINEISKRTIATYAAEGVVLGEISKSARFSNCVWMNTSEVNRRTITITNCLRVKLWYTSLPMLFP